MWSTYLQESVAASALVPSVDPYETYVLLCFSLCSSRPNLRAMTSLLSVGFFGLQILQFATQGDDLIDFVLIVFFELPLPRVPRLVVSSAD